MRTEHAITGSYKTILWHRLREMFRVGTITIRAPVKTDPPKRRFTESITVIGSTETEYLALKRALIRAGCPHIRIAAQYSKGLISATFPVPQDRERLDLCIMKAGLIPHNMKEGAS